MPRVKFTDLQMGAIMRAAHPVCRSDRSTFLADVVAALEGCDEVTNDQLVRVLAEPQLLYRGGAAGGDGT
jgi:hypothetical protein